MGQWRTPFFCLQKNLQPVYLRARMGPNKRPTASSSKASFFRTGGVSRSRSD